MSKSTDKLKLVMDGLTQFPPEKLAKIKELRIEWEYIRGDVEGIFVPNVTLEFFE